MIESRVRALAVVSAVSALIAGASFQSPPPGTSTAVDEAARKLYVANCATCHGETGDGKGVTVLERPARSFKDGGFSYGNTPEALLRTITHGIPGTLMPSFGDALKDPERKSLASYVLTLGPPVLTVESKDTVMVVRDRALVARGKLPSITEGAAERPRGLLIGLPSGLSFEYRVDDVRLLAVRSGEFVDRRDWIGRGGDFLQPLGKIVSVVQSEPAPFTLAASSAKEFGTSSARLLSSVVDGPVATLSYELVTAHEQVLARVLETPDAVATALGPGWKRSFVLDKRREVAIAFRVSRPEAVCGRIDAKTAFSCMHAGSTAVFDVTIARWRTGDAVAEASTSFEDGFVLTPERETSAWTLVEIPGVTLPEDSTQRITAIVRAAGSLK
ncbi:MAG: c-type cytochrome [Planctomycetota bacterium]|nr:c-type cytochrome [Planctomycetota bacterium]